jgi:hypothetical protein
VTYIQIRAELYSCSQKGQDTGGGRLSVAMNEKPGGNEQLFMILVQ